MAYNPFCVCWLHNNIQKFKLIYLEIIMLTYIFIYDLIYKLLLLLQIYINNTLIIDNQELYPT